MGDAAVTGSIDLDKLRGVRWQELALRFVMGAVVSGVAAAVTHYFGDRIGGMFLAFPAILPASLTLVNQKDGKRAAEIEGAGAVFGVLGLFPFAAVVLTWSAMAPVTSVVAALIGWAVASLGLFEACQRAAGARCGGGRR